MCVCVYIYMCIEKQLGYETLFTVSSMFNDEIKIKKKI